MIPSSDQIASDSSPKLVADARARARAPTPRARARRRARGRTGASRRSRRGSARRRSCGRVGTTRVASCCSRRKSSRLRAAQLVEVVVALEHLEPCWSTAQRREGADRLAELLRAPDAVALPERHRAGRAGRRRDDHAVAPDLLDAPRRGAEQEGLAGARLVDHLLVELADAPAVGQRDGEQAAIGDRAGVGDRELARALAGADRARDPVPDDARRAARRTPPTGSGRRACRARSRAARARARRRSGCA